MDYANAGMAAVRLGRAAVSTEGDKAGARTGAVVSGTEAATVARAGTQRKQSCMQACVEDIPCRNIHRKYTLHLFEMVEVKGWLDHGAATFCYTPAFHIDA